MKPFEHAQKVVPVHCLGRHVFVVSIANEHYRLPLTLTPSPQRADVVALIARQIIAGQIAEALRQEVCHAAAQIDQAYLANEIWLPSQASAICRELATQYTVELHTSELHKPDGQTDRHKPT